MIYHAWMFPYFWWITSMKIIGIIFISRHVVERCRRGVLPSKMDLRSLSDWSIYDPRDVGHECDGVTWFLLTSVLPMNRPVASWLPHRARPRIESPGSHLFSSAMQKRRDTSIFLQRVSKGSCHLQRIRLANKNRLAYQTFSDGISFAYNDPIQIKEKSLKNLWTLRINIKTEKLTKCLLDVFPPVV